jgi:hypothetical protein
VHTVAQEQALDKHTRAVTAVAAREAAAAVAGAPQDVGQWGPVVDWPVVGVHVALLSNGKVLAYDSIGDKATETYPVQDRTRATVWDPATGTQTPVNVNTGFNIFCSGLAHLLDGRMFLAGGNKDQQLNGIIQTHLFDPASNLWSLGPNMAAGRWYPTVTPLSNGEMLITSGGPAIPEVRTLAGSLRALSTASLGLPLYPWMDVGPNGRTFYTGPDQNLRAIDTAGTGAWQQFAQRDAINRDYGGHALYDVGKILVAGGGPSTKTALIVNLNGATPQVSSTAPMAFGRRQHNLTVLADGTVLATGGNSSGASLVDLNAGVYAAELWSPATGQWRTLAAMQVTRQYHSTGLLLPDGRVLSAGGGICGICDTVGYLAKNAEIFSPPYLFQADGTLAPRPTIDAAPASTNYGAPIEIATASPGSIRKVALVRLGSVTHSDNMEQRYIPLSFTAGATSVTATAPANANIAPPGIYMLFILDANGVPSVARMVSVLQGATDTTPPTVAAVTPANGAANVSLGTSVSATFSEAIAAASVTATSFVLRDGSGNAVAASVSASGSTATLQPTAPLSSSTTYTATLLGGPAGIKDPAGNALASDFTWSFTTAAVDQTPPSSALSFPAASGSYNAARWNAGCSPSGLCGSASDAGSGVQKVEVSVRRISTNRWWTGTGYTSTTERWIVASGTTSWSYALASSSFPGAGSYSVGVRTTDNSGNVDTRAATTFVYDNTDPNSTVTFPVAQASYTTATWNAGCPSPGICGSASDAVAGVQKVEVSIRRGNASYWNGTSFASASEVFLTTTGTTAWSFSFPASNFPASAKYTISVRATDNAGNVESSTSRRINFAP